MPFPVLLCREPAHVVPCELFFPPFPLCGLFAAEGQVVETVIGKDPFPAAVVFDSCKVSPAVIDICPLQSFRQVLPDSVTVCIVCHAGNGPCPVCLLKQPVTGIVNKGLLCPVGIDHLCYCHFFIVCISVCARIGAVFHGDLSLPVMVLHPVDTAVGKGLLRHTPFFVILVCETGQSCLVRGGFQISFRRIGIAGDASVHMHHFRQEVLLIAVCHGTSGAVLHARQMSLPEGECHFISQRRDQADREPAAVFHQQTVSVLIHHGDKQTLAVVTVGRKLVGVRDIPQIRHVVTGQKVSAAAAHVMVCDAPIA